MGYVTVAKTTVSDRCNFSRKQALVQLQRNGALPRLSVAQLPHGRGPLLARPCTMAMTAQGRELPLCVTLTKGSVSSQKYCVLARTN